MPCAKRKPYGDLSVIGEALCPLDQPGSEPGLELLFRSPPWSVLSGMAPEILLVCLLNLHSRQQPGAISAGFTGGTAQAFHLGQGYGFVPPEQKKTIRRRPDQTLQARAAMCMGVWKGGALCETFHHSS